MDVERSRPENTTSTSRSILITPQGYGSQPLLPPKSDRAHNWPPVMGGEARPGVVPVGLAPSGPGRPRLSPVVHEGRPGRGDRATLPGTAWQPWVATLVRTIFDQPAAEEVHAQHARVVASLEAKHPDAAERLEAAEPIYWPSPASRTSPGGRSDPAIPTSASTRRSGGPPTWSGVPRPCRDRSPRRCRLRADGTDRRE